MNDYGVLTQISWIILTSQAYGWYRSLQSDNTEFLAQLYKIPCSWNTWAIKHYLHETSSFKTAVTFAAVTGSYSNDISQFLSFSKLIFS